MTKGMVDVKDLRPYVMRLFPSARRRLAKLPATRKALKAELRAMVKKIGPSMGKLQIPFHAANLTKNLIRHCSQLTFIMKKIWTGKRFNWKQRICRVRIWSILTIKRMSRHHS